MSDSVNWRKLDSERFEKLGQDLLVARIGTQVKLLGPGGPDGGRDAEYEGDWDEEGKKGYFIFEMKFHHPDSYSHRKESSILVQRDFREVLDRAARLRANHCYLLTNVKCTYRCLARCKEIAGPHLYQDTSQRCLQSCEIWDGRKLDSLLSNHPQVRERYFGRVMVMMVPGEEQQIDRLADGTQTMPALETRLRELSARMDHIGAISRLLRARQYDDVLKELGKVFRAGTASLPRHERVTLLTMQAGALRALERHTEALTTITDVYELDEDSVQSAVNLIFCLRDAGRGDEAQLRVEQGMERWPKMACMAVAAAIVEADNLKMDEAMRYIDCAIELERDSPVAWHVRACLEARRGRFKRAIADCEHALQLEGSDPAILNQMGVLCLRMADVRGGKCGRQPLAQALSYFERATVLGESVAKTRFGRGIRLNLAIVNLLSGELRRAIGLFSALMDAQEFDHIVWACLGECYVLSGSWHEAERAYREAMKRGVNDSAIRNNLVLCYSCNDG